MYEFAKNYAVSQNRLAYNKKPPQKPCGVSGKSWFFSSSLQNVERFHIPGKSRQTKGGSCLGTIIANGGETSLNQDNLRLIPSFLILIFFVQI